MPRLGRAAALACALGVAAWSLAAQSTISLDVSAARVEYDGFLPSGAVSASPAFLFTTPSTSVSVRGTWLGFESGNTSVQGLLAGSAFTSAFGHWRGEVSATAGASSYQGLASFSHVLGRGRVHYLASSGGSWLAATLGQASYDNGTQMIGAVAAGIWLGQRGRNFTVAVSGTRVGDTSYADIEGTGYVQAGRLELEGSLGARSGRGGGDGVYGEAVAVLALTRPLALTLGLGRYPTDPIRGSVSGRYASIGVRLSSFSPRPPPPSAPPWPQPSVVPLPVAGSNGHLAAAAIELELTSGEPLLVVRASGATIVEIMGDFTDWQPVALTRVGDVWRLQTRLPAGLRRLNVRVDGGSWSVPVGATLEHDEFGATVGTIVVP